MSREVGNRKRKAVTRDSSESNEAAIFDELGNRALDGGSSQSEEEDSGFDEDEDSEVASLDGEELDDDEIPSEESDADDAGLRPKLNGMKHLEINEDEEDSDELDEEEDVDERNYTITKDANGNPRYVYREIDPVYDSDDSDAPATANTIGNIPLTFYDSYPHIGYDINGQKIMRPAKGQALDSLLDSIDIPQGWTGLTDPATGKPLHLSQEELEVLKKLTRNEAEGEGYDPYPEMVEYFTGKVEQMPLSAAPEPKRRFVPSKHEAKRVMKIVRAIKEGRIQPYKPPGEEEPVEDSTVKRYDIWENEAPRPDHPMNIPAPKLPPPGYDESYHPPPEYLPDDDELKAYKETDEEDREKEYLPTDHDALRKVPGYERLIKEKFERCLDLYLAPRVRRSKLNIDPESLLPKLPSPEELRPFPSKCEKVFRGHEGRVRSVAVNPRGDMIASGGSDGTARIWDFQGRQLWKAKLSDQDAVNEVQWRPGTDAFILTAAAGENLFFILPSNLIPGTDNPEVDAIANARDLLNAGWQSQETNGSSASNKQPAAKWQRPIPALQELGVFIQVTLRSTIKVISWHRRGDHVATVSPQSARSAVTIHTLSKHLTQVPFRRLKGLPQAVQFHPLKPILFVATQRLIRSYDLVRQEPLKILQPGARWIAGFDIHPAGENLVVASYDKRLLWMDMELDVRPYKVLRYHERAIRAAKYHHGGFPLFCDASDDGSVQVFHGKVVGDLMQNANIVPIKKLWGHAVEAGLGVLDVDWHPSEPWIVSAGADGTCRLWT